MDGKSDPSIYRTMPEAGATKSLDRVMVLVLCMSTKFHENNYHGFKTMISNLKIQRGIILQINVDGVMFF